MVLVRWTPHTKFRNFRQLICHDFRSYEEQEDFPQPQPGAEGGGLSFDEEGVDLVGP